MMGWRQIPSAADADQSGSPSAQTNPPLIRPFQVRAFKLKVEKRKRIAAPLPPPTPEPVKRKPPGRPKTFPSPKLEHHQFFDRCVASKPGTFAKRLNTSQADLLLTRWWDLRAPKSTKAAKNWRAFMAKNAKGEDYLKNLRDTLDPAFVVYLFAYGYTVRHPRDRSEIDEVFPYDLVARDFLQDLDVGRIPMSLLGTWKTLEPRVDGYIVAEILDYRSHCLDFQALLKPTDQHVSIQPSKRRALLKPTEENSVHELSTRAYRKRAPHGVGREIGWTDGEWVTFGRVVLGNDPPPICIDPSTVVFSIASIVNYNRQKFNILKKARYRRRLSLMRSAIEDQVDELELWGSADCDKVNGASSLNTSYTSHDDKPHGRSPTKRLEKLPMAKEMKDVRPISVSVSAQQPTRVLRFSTPHRLSLMPAKLRLPEGRRVEIHRDVDDYWIVAIVFFVNPKFDQNQKPADFRHHFTSFREATAFIEELKLQYSREQRQLQYDSLEHCNTLTDCAVDIDKVFLQTEPDLAHTHEYISNNNAIITGATAPGGAVTVPERTLSPQPLATNIPPIPIVPMLELTTNF
eukprot:m.90300 g.90300  ORF g.90300 m.90300 type:complete len:574 (+) comp26383_c0_seq2:156-1877(+)